MEVGTLKELGVEVGDVVQVVGLAVLGTSIENGGEWTIKSIDGDIFLGVKPEYINKHNGVLLSGTWHLWRIISRAKYKPKLWRDMTPEEKGALLLAAHEGKVIEEWTPDIRGVNPQWLEWHPQPKFMLDGRAYRIKLEPKIETVALCWRHDVGTVKNKIGTINLIDGKPDCASIKMDEV